MTQPSVLYAVPMRHAVEASRIHMPFGPIEGTIRCPSTANPYGTGAFHERDDNRRRIRHCILTVGVKIANRDRAGRAQPAARGHDPDDRTRD